ncbi:MAG: DNA replication and repair protein RecF [Gammaproteobacteria bacterium]|nr:DNA replication and repair protein RecF [Gammaproteobacteria bacterium]
MLIKSLTLSNVRNIREARLNFHENLTIITGANGAGKSSLLEGLTILSSGKSFRTANIKSVISDKSNQLTVYCEALDSRGEPHKLGIQRDRQGGFKAKIDGHAISRLVDLTTKLPVFAIYPGFYEKVSEKRASRIKVFDWGVFHVEHQFFTVWSKYQKSLKQRNALLKQKVSAKSSELAFWTDSLINEGRQLNQMRSAYLTSIMPKFQSLLKRTSLGESIELDYYPGHARSLDLNLALAKSFESDIYRGTTGSGPHRADIRFLSGQKDIFESASRGQQKLLINTLLIAMIELFTERSEQPALVCIDDLPSELDVKNQADLIAALCSLNRTQILLTSITESSLPEAISGYNRVMFHVEHGVFQQRNLQ